MLKEHEKVETDQAVYVRSQVALEKTDVALLRGRGEISLFTQPATKNNTYLSNLIVQKLDDSLSGSMAVNFDSNS